MNRNVLFLSLGALLLASACARQEATSPTTDPADTTDPSATTESTGESTAYPDPATTDPATADPTMSGESESSTSETTPPPATPEDPATSGETAPDTEQPPRQ